MTVKRLDPAAIAGAPPWEQPIPLALAGGAALLPTFPVDVFPPWVGEWVLAIAAEKGATADLPAGLVLGVAAGAIQRGTSVLLRGGFTESTSLYPIAAVAPGQRKSPVFAEALRPVRIVERALQTAWTAESARRARMADDEGLDVDELDGLEEPELEELGPKPRLTTDDATPEAVGRLLAGGGRGRIIVASDEAAGFFANMAGRYSSSPSWDVFNQGHTGSDVTIDRVTAEAQYVERAAISLVIATQPAVLVELCRSGGSAGRGVLSRPLYMLPAPVWPELPTPTAEERIKNVYLARMRALYDRAPRPTRNEYGELTPYYLRLTDRAAAAFVVWERECQERTRALEQAGAPADAIGWALKLAGQTGRIAAGLHALDRWTGDVLPALGSVEDRIGTATLARSIRVARCYIEHAGGVFGLAAESAEHAAAVRVLKAIGRRVNAGKGFTFSTRDVWRQIGDRETGAYFEAALRTLESRGYVRLVDAGERGGGKGGRGTSSPTWEAHPGIVTLSGATPTDSSDSPTVAEFVT